MKEIQKIYKSIRALLSHVHISPTRPQSFKVRQWATKMMQKESCKLGHPNKITGRMISSEFQCSGLADFCEILFIRLHSICGRGLSKGSATMRDAMFKSFLLRQISSVLRVLHLHDT